MVSHLTVRMDRPDLEGLPPFSLPPGYVLTHDTGDVLEEWTEFLTLCFPENGVFDPARWRSGFLDQPQYHPRGVMFIRREGALCATAFCWLDDPDEKETGRVHWVGVSPEYRGLGLGRQVTLAVLHHMREVALSRAMLETQTFRIPAVRLYLGMGFTPTPRNEVEQAEWDRFFAPP